MDWLQFSASVIGSLAWPVAAVCVGAMFRSRIADLLGKLRSFEGPVGLKATFDQEVKQVAVDVHASVAAASQSKEPIQLPASPERGRDQVIPATQGALQQYFDLGAGELRPSAMIISAWDRVENEIHELLKNSGVAWLTDDYRPMTREEALVRAGIPRAIAETISELQRLRNRVAHLDNFEPTHRSAVNFVRSADQVLPVVREARQKLSK